MSKSNKANANPQVSISKTMSWILRHGLNELNLVPDNLGRIKLNDLLNLKEMKQVGASEAIVRQIVETSDKQRFRLDEVNGVWMIGANQGHSKDIGAKIDNSKLMERIVSPVDLCVHGTYKKIISTILETGLKPMSRTHIHFASGYPEDNGVISGARNSSNVFIELNMEQALADGMIFYRSANGVILTEGIGGVVEPKYFKNIVYK